MICQKSVRNRVLILSRISSGFESRQNHAARNPGVGSVGQVLVHPSHICQIGESDQDPIVWPSNPQPLPHKVDTDLVENMIRPTKLGAKNSMFFGSLDAGTNNALFYTLMANCKNHGLDPEMYLSSSACP